MDVYQILIQDHRTIAKMFEEIAGTSNIETERRKQLFSDLWATLEEHEITEENDFLPELVEASSFSPEAGRNAAIRELAAEIFDDHSDFEAVFQQISNLSTGSDEWLERINELGDLVREHARKEEEKLFPAARKELDQSRAEESDDKFGEGAGEDLNHSRGAGSHGSVAGRAHGFPWRP